nr:hypothetical protein [Dermatophilus congolensis]
MQHGVVDAEVVDGGGAGVGDGEGVAGGVVGVGEVVVVGVVVELGCFGQGQGGAGGGCQVCGVCVLAGDDVPSVGDGGGCGGVSNGGAVGDVAAGEGVDGARQVVDVPGAMSRFPQE